jgi:alpha-beta hydrolase superfamily lysophospholipase
LLKLVKIAAGVAASISLLTLAAPLVGEAIATLPPSYTRSIDPLTELDLPYEDVTFPTTDGLMLRGWFIPAGDPSGNAPAVVYAPATRHDQRSGLSLVPSFHTAGYHVLLFSYRGHALSDGPKGQFTYGAAESKDVDAAVQFLNETKGVREIGIIGHSAGAVSAILSGARNPRVGAVVAVAPFNCVDEVWHSNRPAAVPPFIMNWTLWVSEKVRGFKSDEVCPVRVVDQIAPRPLLVIHGTDDQRISEEQVRRLFDAAQAPKTLWMVEGATHSGIRNPVLDDLAPDVIAFLDGSLRDQQGPLSPVAHGSQARVTPL